MICGTTLQTFILVIIVLKTNWTDEVSFYLFSISFEYSYGLYVT